MSLRAFDLDYSERDGFMVGRTAAIADWRHEKEQREFSAYCKRLYLERWRKANPAKVAAYNRAWWSKPAVRARCNERRKRARRKQDATEHVCPECQVSFCFYRAPWVGGPRSKFCSSACYQRDRYQQRTPGARRIRRRP